MKRRDKMPNKTIKKLLIIMTFLLCGLLYSCSAPKGSQEIHFQEKIMLQRMKMIVTMLVMQLKKVLKVNQYMWTFQEK